MKLSEFIEEYCNCCETQHCDPKDPNYRYDCKYWKEIRNKEIEQEYLYKKELLQDPEYWDKIKKMRELTHCNIIEGRDALIRALGDIEEAVRLIQSGELKPPRPWK